MTQREFIDFLNKVEVLKHNTRHCWGADGRRESVAEHCWRLSLMPMLVKDEFPYVDIDKVIKMCIIHDLGEAVTGDIPAFEKTDDDEIKEAQLLREFLSSLPENVKAEFVSLLDEMDELKTPEAKLYKAFDNLEAVISHNEAPLDTWTDIEYSANLTYGDDKVAWHPWLTVLRKEIRKDTEKKIDEAD